MKRIDCFLWTATSIDDMTARWNRGESALQIARAFEQEFKRKFTRNQIIGKLARLGLTSSAARLTSSRASAGKRTAAAKGRPIKRKDQTAGGGASAPSGPMVKATSTSLLVHSPQVAAESSSTIKALLQYAAVSDQDGVDLIDLPDDGCRLILGKTSAGIERYCGLRCERGAGGRFKPYCADCSRGKSDAKLSKPKPSSDVWDTGRQPTGFRYSRRDGARNAR